MRIAVCDNDSDEVLRLVTALNRAGIQKHLNISCYFDTEAFVRDISEFGFRIVFYKSPEIATQMVDEITALRRSGYKGYVVLLSSEPEIAFNGYLVDAAGVLPLTFDDSMINALLEHLSRDRCCELSFYSGRAFVSIPWKEIIYIESSRSASIIHTADGCFTVNKTLSELESQLGEQFLRCHRSYIVNLDYVRSAYDDFILYSGERVLMRRRSQKELRCIFERYINEKK